jgi:hypothetical protein
MRRAANIRSVPPKKSDKVQLSLRVTRLEFDALQRMADRYGLTLTEVVREWLRGLDTYEPNPPRARPPKVRE